MKVFHWDDDAEAVHDWCADDYELAALDSGDASDLWAQSDADDLNRVYFLLRIMPGPGLLVCAHCGDPLAWHEQAVDP